MWLSSVSTMDKVGKLRPGFQRICEKNGLLTSSALPKDLLSYFQLLLSISKCSTMFFSMVFTTDYFLRCFKQEHSTNSKGICQKRKSKCHTSITGTEAVSIPHTKNILQRASSLHPGTLITLKSQPISQALEIPSHPHLYSNCCIVGLPGPIIKDVNPIYQDYRNA